MGLFHARFLDRDSSPSAAAQCFGQEVWDSGLQSKGAGAELC